MDLYGAVSEIVDEDLLMVLALQWSVLSRSAADGIRRPPLMIVAIGHDKGPEVLDGEDDDGPVLM